MSTSQTILVTAGAASIIGAIVGGGFELANVKVPLVASRGRQALLAMVGIGLLLVGLWIDPDSGLSKRLFGQEQGQAAREVVDETFRLDPVNRTRVWRDLMFCFWNVTPFDPAGGRPRDMPTRHQEENRDLKLKLIAYRVGEQGRTCDEPGSIPPLRQGQAIAVPHPTCRLQVAVTSLRRRIRPQHSWEEFVAEGRRLDAIEAAGGDRGEGRSSWFDTDAEIRLTGDCPAGSG